MELGFQHSYRSMSNSINWKAKTKTLISYVTKNWKAQTTSVFMPDLQNAIACCLVWPRGFQRVNILMETVENVPVKLFS